MQPTPATPAATILDTLMPERPSDEAPADKVFDGDEDEYEHHHDHDHTPLAWHLKLINLLAVVVPFVAFLVAIVLLWGWGVSWTSLALFVAMYVATTMGVTVGFHRLFTHKAFDTVRPVKAVLGVMGSMAVQGPVLKWAATHRRHHKHSDHHDDPHSPHLHGHGMKGFVRGLFHAHMGWLFQGEPKHLEERYVPDLHKDKMLRVIDRMFVVWVATGLILPAIFGGLITMSWTGALLGFIWGGLVRVFFVHHVTWSINSVCHVWGRREFRSHDESRNNAVFGVLALGEGWHNNHHAFPTSARHGLKWWQFDASYVVIKTLAALKLAWNVRTPRPAALEAKRLA